MDETFEIFTYICVGRQLSNNLFPHLSYRQPLPPIISATMKRLKHIGVDSFSAMRKKILSDYEIAKFKTKDDAAQVDHGNVGESAIRNWLKDFLPKRFDVCKGYIITTNLDYEGPLEEWDIIIYDVLESPILFTRNSGELSETKRAIPIEYVRGVIEVKSVLDTKSAKKAEQKLEKLNSFIGQNKSDNYPIFSGFFIKQRYKISAYEIIFSL